MNRRASFPVWLIVLLVLMSGALIALGIWSSSTDERSIQDWSRDWSRDNPLAALGMLLGGAIIIVVVCAMIIREVIRASRPHD